MKDTLKTLPTGPKAYDYAYDEAMKRISGHDADSEKLAKLALSWIACTKRLLTTSELQHALAVEADDSELDEENLPEIEDIVSVCVGLVTVDEESNIIRLVHYTTQEYFERMQKCWLPDAETDITRACVTYLSFNAFNTGYCPSDKEFEARLQENVLYDYAARNWGHHARAASTQVEQLITQLLESKAKVSSSSQALMASRSYRGYSQKAPKQMMGVHLAAYFGLEEAMIVLLKNKYNLNSEDTYARTPLSYAAANGHEAVVKLLLEKEAAVETADRYGQTPLLYAAAKGHETVVKLLLEKEAAVETADRSGQTPLLYAATRGHEAVVKLLLEKEAVVETADRSGQTPLSCAAARGHEAVVKLLLEKEAAVETADAEYGRTPLSYAAARGHEAVVKLLLEKEAVVETADRYGHTPLLYAAANGHEAVVKLLLDKGANIDAKDYLGWTALQLATFNRRVNVEQLLVLNGASEPEDFYGLEGLFSIE